MRRVRGLLAHWSEALHRTLPSSYYIIEREKPGRRIGNPLFLPSSPPPMHSFCLSPFFQLPPPFFSLGLLPISLPGQTLLLTGGAKWPMLPCKPPSPSSLCNTSGNTGLCCWLYISWCYFLSGFLPISRKHSWRNDSLKVGKHIKYTGKGYIKLLFWPGLKSIWSISLYRILFPGDVETFFVFFKTFSFQQGFARKVGGKCFKLRPK